MEYFLFIGFACLVFFLFEKGLIKLFRIEKQSISKTAGKKIDQWGRGIIVFVSLCVLVFVIEMDIYIKWFFICFFSISSGFQLIMELVYLKQTKQYIITLTFLLLTLTILYHTEFLIEKFRFLK